MNIAIAIQLNFSLNDNLQKHLVAIEELGLKLIWFSTIMDTNEIIGLDEFAQYDKVIIFGSVKVIKLWQDGHFPDNVVMFYDEPRFDQQKYAPKLGNYLLNHSAKYTTLGVIQHIPVNADTFIKPTRDLKAFAGRIVDKGKTPAEELFSAYKGAWVTDDEPVLMNKVHKIVKEYRNFIVDGVIIDSSSYKEADTVQWQPITDSEKDQIANFFTTVQKLYQPLDTYVVDFALMESGGFSVIEYNCLNCSGMYTINRVKLFKALINKIAC